mgnify:CR=1 FL=1
MQACRDQPGERTADGDFAGIGKRNAGTTLQLDVAGRSGLGVPVGSVVLNLTVDQPADAGFLTVALSLASSRMGARSPAMYCSCATI